MIGFLPLILEGVVGFGGGFLPVDNLLGAFISSDLTGVVKALLNISTGLSLGGEAGWKSGEVLRRLEALS